MHRNDNSNYFLYIEPSLEEKSSEPIDDIYTHAVQYFFDRSTSGAAAGYSNLESKGDQSEFNAGSGYRGFHENCDDIWSSNQDYLFPNGFITNSLCIHYVRWFRNSITGFNLEKLEILKNLYETSK